MKKLKVCADPFPPYQYFDEEGQIKGSDYSRVKAALEKAGYDTEFIIDSWENIYTAFENGEMDVLFQAQDSPERIARFKLSEKLRNADTDILTLNPNLIGLERHSDLADYRIGVIKGFNNGPEIDELPDICKIEFEGTPEVLEGLRSGETDFAVGDSGVIGFLSKPEDNFLAVRKLRYSRPLYVLFNDETIRDDFNAALKELK